MRLGLCDILKVFKSSWRERILTNSSSRMVVMKKMKLNEACSQEDVVHGEGHAETSIRFW